MRTVPIPNISKLFTQGGLITGTASLIFYEFPELERRFRALERVFPDSALHATAIKANPLPVVLHFLQGMGAGAEAASHPEIQLALHAGFPPEKIVFDSPCKTRKELRFALKMGIHVNADSFAELDRIGAVLTGIEKRCSIGLRINPQVGTGRIRATSVAEKVSKFGVPILECRERIIGAFDANPWLNGLHVHIGSQGCPPEILLKGTRIVCDLAAEIQALLSRNGRKLEFIDIGGGLPVTYRDDEPAMPLDDYASALQKHCPELFDGNYQVITEFGRYLHANAGHAITKVEYVKEFAEASIIVVHLGADFLLRKAYSPDDWHHEITLLGPDGRPKKPHQTKKYTVAGPLCFAGDIIARDVELPIAEEGDHILIHDTGAYTLSMWSRYNSRQIPPVLALTDKGGSTKLLREGESPDDLIAFWQGDKAADAPST